MFFQHSFLIFRQSRINTHLSVQPRSDYDPIFIFSRYFKFIAFVIFSIYTSRFSHRFPRLLLPIMKDPYLHHLFPIYVLLFSLVPKLFFLYTHYPGAKKEASYSSETSGLGCFFHRSLRLLCENIKGEQQPA